MTALSDLRDRLVETLRDVQVTVNDETFPIEPFASVPEAAAPPLIYVAPGFPYISSEGQTFGAHVIRHAITVVAPQGTNDTALAALEQMVIDVINAIDASGLSDVDQVNDVGAISISGQSYLGATVEVITHDVRL